MNLEDFLKVINTQQDDELKNVLKNVYADIQNMKKTIAVLESKLDNSKQIEELIDVVNMLVNANNRPQIKPVNVPVPF